MVDQLGFKDIPESIIETICLNMSDANPIDLHALKRLVPT